MRAVCLRQLSPLEWVIRPDRVSHRGVAASGAATAAAAAIVCLARSEPVSVLSWPQSAQELTHEELSFGFT